MSRSRTTLGMILVGLAVMLAGCAGGGSEMRPVMAMDGQQFNTTDPIENGRAMIMTGQLGLAVDVLTQVVSNDRRNARALTLLAVAYGKMRRFDLADRYNAEALQIDPNSVAALNNWGYSYLVRGDRARATDLLERAAATADGRPVVAANLALARNDGQPATLPFTQAASPVDAMRSIQLSQHVVLVRPTGRLMRLAPGVQMLLTASQPFESSPMPALLPPAPPVRQAALGVDPLAGTDTRFALFRALFALMEGKQYPPSESVRLAAQVAAAAASTPTPFGYFPDVDDFTQQ